MGFSRSYFLCLVLGFLLMILILGWFKAERAEVPFVVEKDEFVMDSFPIPNMQARLDYLISKHPDIEVLDKIIMSDNPKATKKFIPEGTYGKYGDVYSYELFRWRVGLPRTYFVRLSVKDGVVIRGYVSYSVE